MVTSSRHEIDVRFPSTMELGLTFVVSFTETLGLVFKEAPADGQPHNPRLGLGSCPPQGPALSPGSDGDPCGSLSPAPEGVWAALLNVPHRLTCLPFPQLRRTPAICPGEGLALTGVHVMLTFGPSQKKKNKDHL